MRMNRIGLLDASLIFVAGVAIPLEAFLFIQGAYGVAIATTGIIVLGLIAMLVGWNPDAATSIKPELELMETVPPPPLPLTVRVEATRGVCALGYRTGSVWTVDKEGRLLASLCRPAVAALSPILQSGGRKDQANQAWCECPLGDRRVLFAVEQDSRGRPVAHPSAA